MSRYQAPGRTNLDFFRAQTADDVFRAYENGTADINMRIAIGDFAGNALMKACIENNLEVVQALIKCNADTYAIIRGKTAALIAVENGYVNIIDVLYKNYPGEFGKISGITPSPLSRAFELGNKKVIDYFVKQNIDLDAQEKWWDTPLHLAIEELNVDVVKILLSRGAHPWSGIMTALAMKHSKDERVSQIVELLIAAGANAKIINEINNTLFHLAAMFGSVGMVSALVKLHDSNYLNLVNNEDKTALMIACEEHEYEIVEIMLEYGAQAKFRVDIPNEDTLWYNLSIGDWDRAKIIVEDRSDYNFYVDWYIILNIIMIYKKNYDLVVSLLQWIDSPLTENSIKKFLKKEYPDHF